MALPVFRAAGAKSAGTTAAVTVSAPTGVATGDLEILIAEVPTAATCSITNNGGGAWTAMTGSPITVAAGERLYVWSRIRVGGDGDPQVTASADHVCAARLAYQTGTFDTSDPFELETTSSETTSDTSFSWAPGGTTGGADRLVLVISSILRDSNTASVPVCTNASVTALASRANYCTNSGAGGGFGVTEGAKATAGTVGTFACTYAAASPKSYISFAIKPVGAANLFGASSVAETVATTTVAKLTALAAAAVAETVAVATVGVRKTFGVVAVAETVGITTAGTVSKPGATSLEVTAAITTSGRVDAKAASSLNLSVAAATVGKLTALGTTTLTETVGSTTAGARTVFGATTVAETVSTGTVGVLDAHSASTLVETVSTDVAGTRDTFAATALTETVTVTTAGDVSTGPTTHFGATSLSPVATITTIGTVDTHASASLTAALTATTTGTLSARSSSSVVATVTITTAGSIGAGVITGSTSLALTVAIHTGTGPFAAGSPGVILYAPIGQVAGSKTGRVVV